MFGEIDNAPMFKELCLENCVRRNCRCSGCSEKLFILDDRQEHVRRFMFRDLKCGVVSGDPNRVDRKWFDG